MSFKITSTIIRAWLSPNSLWSDADTVETEGPYNNRGSTYISLKSTQPKHWDKGVRGLIATW